MIAILIDFFMEKKSPLKNFLVDSKKILSMGSKFNNPPFDPLFHCLAILTRHIKNISLAPQNQNLPVILLI